MPVCLGCKSEYGEGVKICANCVLELMNKLQIEIIDFLNHNLKRERKIKVC